MRYSTLRDVVIAVVELPSYLAEISEGIELLRQAVDRMTHEIVGKLDSLEGTVMMHSGD